MRQQYFENFEAEFDSSERLLKVGSVFQLKEERHFLLGQIGKLTGEMMRRGDTLLAYEIAENKRNLRKLESRIKELGEELCVA